MRSTLFTEVIYMAFDTVRTTKMRSGLTILGVVIGITSIVGMTAMTRRFDPTLRDIPRAGGADHPRRGHRQPRDRGHDGDDPRLRPVAARHDPRGGAEHDLRPAIRHHE